MMSLMKRTQTEDSTTKRRGYRFWLIRIAIFLGLPLLFYYGYCWGFWGRNSLLLQYLFQCSCPLASEEARYPEEVDVIVPACRHVSSKLSPSGHFLYVREKIFWRTSSYLLDLQTDEKIPTPLLEREPYFLTDDLLYISISYKNEEYILNRVTGEQSPIQKFRALRPDAFINGDADLEILANALRGAKYVFLINDNDTVVALTTDFLVNPEHNFTTDRFDIPGFGPDRLERFLKENNIMYNTIQKDFPGEVFSPDGRLIARNDGIYLVETDQKVVEGFALAARGWTDDSHAVIYSQYIIGPCLIRTNFGILDDFACFFEVPQPVLLLKVPEEYLTPTETP